MTSQTAFVLWLKFWLCCSRAAATDHGALQRAALSGDPKAEQLSGRIVGRLGTDQDRARLSCWLHAGGRRLGGVAGHLQGHGVR